MATGAQLGVDRPGVAPLRLRVPGGERSAQADHEKRK